MIVPLGEKHINEVASIYASELPSSLLVLLGRDFLGKFYYKHVAKHPQSVSFVYLVHGKVAGFVVGVREANSFFNRLVKAYFGELVLVLFIAVCKNPWLLGSIIKAVGFMLSKPKGYETETDDAEIITLAVRPEFRTLGFFKDHGVKVANELISVVLNEFRKTGVRRVKAFIEKPNFLAQFFYKNFGFRYVCPLRIYDMESGLYLLELAGAK